MSLRTVAIRRIVVAGLIYVAFLLVIGELPSQLGAATLGLSLVWFGQVAWEVWALSRRPAA